jgi:hypothetical protein
MKITLRKASALQNAIQEAVKAIEVAVKVELNQFQGDAVLESARQKALTNESRRAELTRVLYQIRAQVGQANVASGIDARLASAAYIDKRIGQLQGCISADALQEDAVVISGKLEQIRSSKDEGRRSIYGFHDTVSTGVFTQADIVELKAKQQSLKKEKQKMNDEILELNVRTEITLTDDAVAVLTREGLV